MILINRKDLPEANAVCKTCGRQYRLCKRCLKLRSMGLESWREYCDCAECYQVYSVLSKDTKDITKDELERVKEIQLPEGQEYTKETKERFKEVEEFINKNSRIAVQADAKKNTGLNENKSAESKRYDFGYNKKKNLYKNK